MHRWFPFLRARRIPGADSQAAACAAAMAVAAALWLATPLAAQRQRVDRERADREPRSAIYLDPTGRWRLDPTGPVEDALDRYDPAFEPWTQDDYPVDALAGYPFSPVQTPWAVVGDFNGDGLTDVAVAGRTDRDAVVLLVLSAGVRRYRAFELTRVPYDPEVPGTILLPVLSFRYPGRYVVADRRLLYPREIVVERPVVQLTGGGREGAVLFAVEQRGIASYYLSDRPAPPLAPAAPVLPR